jgi:hypothetical protein
MDMDEKRDFREGFGKFLKPHDIKDKKIINGLILNRNEDYKELKNLK